MDLLMQHELPIFVGTIDLWKLLQCQSTSLDDQVVNADLDTLLLRESYIEFLAKFQSFRHIDLVANVEMRNSLLRLRQTACDCLLHRRKRHDLRVRHRYFRDTDSGCSHRLRLRCCCGGYCTLFNEVLNIVAHNTTTRSSTLHLEQINTVFFGHASSQRGCFDKYPVRTYTVLLHRDASKNRRLLHCSTLMASRSDRWSLS